ncbi:Conserved hypothetical protein 95 [Verrucomicrobiia bacterium DG1235]|nr:Conserved hypothetical protein 95 [Verrucomicrobiae bacterium DG1235]
MDKLRQGIFSSIGTSINGARVLDLFAGTGSYGLEALSRGASHATFVELNRRATAMVQTNAAIVAKSMQEKLDTLISTADATKWTPPAERFDIIFVDPPYEALEQLTPKLFPLFEQALTPDGLVVFEAPGQFEPAAAGWRLRKRLGKGRDQPTACLLHRT